MLELDEYIRVYDNVLRKEFRDTIVERFRTSNLWLEDLSRGAETIDLADRENRATHADIDEMLYRAVTNASRLYSQDFPEIKIRRDIGYELLRYNQNSIIEKDHAFLRAEPAVLFCSIALNEEYEGGEFMFAEGRTNRMITAGTAIVFPASFIYSYSVSPVRKGQRMSAVTWLM